MSVPPPPDADPLLPPAPPPVPPPPDYAPPGPTAPPRRRPLLVLGANLAGVLLVCLLLFWALTAFADHRGGTSATGTAPAQAMKLTVPRTLLHGRYTLSSDLSASLRQQYGEPQPGADGLTPAGGEYHAGPDSALDTLSFWGGYGHIGSPDLFRRGMLMGLGLPSGVRRVTEPKTLTATGSGTEVDCEVLALTRDGTTLTLPVCVWDDSGTAVTVTHETPRIAYQDPAAVDLQSLADLTGTVIDEVRAPARIMG